MSNRNRYLALMTVLVLSWVGPGAVLGAQEGYPAEPSRVMPTPRAGEEIEVVLSFYSGRPNPSWTLAGGEEHERILALVKGLDIRDEELFDYAAWNRIGLPSFWLELGAAEGLPRKVHVYRDMAVVVEKQPEALGYAEGASELYDLLVRQAIERDHGELFEEKGEETE